MNPDLTSRLWDLPSAKDFLSGILKEISEGISIFLVYPGSYIESGMEEVITRSLSNNSQIHEYNVLDIDLDSQLPPPEFLKQAFPRCYSASYLEKIVESPFIPNLLIIKGIKSCSEENRKLWVLAFSRWAEASRSLGNKKAILFMVPSDVAVELDLPPKDIRLSYRVWAGLPSNLEVRLLCRLHSEDLSAESQWREHMLASLAGNDIQLCEWLWNKVMLSTDELIEALKEYADYVRWNQKTNFDWITNWRPKPPGFNLYLYPTDKTFRQLSQMYTIYSPEFGEEIHPAILAMRGQREDICHRIWRANSNLILPIIDDVRRRLCDYLTARYGVGWAILEEQVLTSPVELSKLRRIIDECPQYSWEKRQWATGIRSASVLRNNLAHYQTVRFESFYQFWQTSKSIHGMMYKINGIGV